jgi:restriction system protein
MLPQISDLMLPALREACASDEVSVDALVRKFSADFQVTFEDRLAATFRNRSQSVAGRFRTARLYLTRAGLIESTKAGHFRITPLGRSVVESDPPLVDREYLSRFPSFLEGPPKREARA